MKRIVLLVCAILFLVSNSAEARWTTPSGRTYSQPARTTTYYNTYNNTRATQPVRTTAYRPSPAQPVRATTATYNTRTAQPAQARTVSYSPSPAQPVRTTTSYSTSTAQGVANLMASRGAVGHFGGNTGYEGCGAGASPAAAYNNCCYANSGMTTVDVGYARSANGMWFCCRRYR